MLEYSGSIKAESSLSSLSFEIYLLSIFDLDVMAKVVFSFLRGDGDILHTRDNGKVNESDILKKILIRFKLFKD